jgi:hypothetical protein
VARGADPYDAPLVTSPGYTTNGLHPLPVGSPPSTAPQRLRHPVLAFVDSAASPRRPEPEPPGVECAPAPHDASDDASTDAWRSLMLSTPACGCWAAACPVYIPALTTQRLDMFSPSPYAPVHRRSLYAANERMWNGALVAVCEGVLPACLLRAMLPPVVSCIMFLYGFWLRYIVLILPPPHLPLRCSHS